MSKRKDAPRKDAPRKADPGKLLIGFDGEWQVNKKGDRNNAVSYQVTVVNPETRARTNHVIHVKPDRRGKHQRYLLAEILSLAVLEARKAGVIDYYPSSIILAGHFIRSDLSMCEDFHTYLKRKLAAVHGTLATTNRRLPLNLPFSDGARRVTVQVIDTMLHAPAKSSLSQLGITVGLHKLEIMEGYSIGDMARYRDEQLEDFNAYAERDAEIAALYTLEIMALYKKLGIPGLPPTVAAAGVAMFKGLFLNKTEWLEFLGLDTGPRSEKRSHWKAAFHLTALMSAAAGCYHGGLNTIFYVGYSPIGRTVWDVDLRGAYPTALAAIQRPDWDSARDTKSLDELSVVDEAMTFAQVRFKFPPNTKSPCIPIRAADKRGLIYPIEGEAWCCGPELVVAREMGASIVVVQGYIVPWIPNSASPFVTFTRNITAWRKAFKADGNVLHELIIKLLANSLYGKIAQGVSSKRPDADDVSYHRGFDTEFGEQTNLPPSSITCPAIAAWATSFVRAVMIEALHRLPPTAIPLMLTTDGLLYCGDQSDIDTSGRIAQAYKRARALVEDDDDLKIWEFKHKQERVISFKTRGVIGVGPTDTLLAKAGARLPEHLATDEEKARYAERLYCTRTPDTKFVRRQLTSLSEQWRTGSDLLAKDVDVTLSWCFDLKNKPVEPATDVEGVLSLFTQPWSTITEFEARRESFEEWKRNQRRVLRTARDYSDMMEWAALRRTNKAVRANSRGVLPNLARAVLAEYLRRPLNMREDYPVISERLSLATGCRVTTQHIKDVRAKVDQIERQCVSYLSAKDIEFARRYGTYPVRREWLRGAIIPGSTAERQFADIWEKRLPAPAPAIETEHINGFDYFRIFEERRRLLMPNVGHDEARFRAIEFTVDFCRRKLGIDFEAAKSTVLAALRAA